MTISPFKKLIVIVAMVLLAFGAIFLLSSPPSTAPQCDVDLNGDGDCTRRDIQILSEIIGACRGEVHYRPRADVDQDGCVTRKDQEQLFPMFVRESGSPCDLNFDGKCDKKDYDLYESVLRGCFGIPLHPGYSYNPLADANRDGCVLGNDGGLLFQNIGEY